MSQVTGKVAGFYKFSASYLPAGRKRLHVATTVAAYMPLKIVTPGIYYLNIYLNKIIFII